MAALNKDRNTPHREGSIYAHPVKGASKIHAGALVALAAGFAQGGSTALNLVAVGRAEQAVDNTNGADGAVFINVRRGVFRFENSAAADLIDRTKIGGTAYIVDDQTVAATHGGNTRSAAGTIVDVDDDGVWVRVG